jgi:hypothetical protein
VIAWNRRTVTVAITLTTLAFVLVAYMVPNTGLLVVMRSLQMASSMAVAIRFWPAAAAGWRDDFKTSASIFAFCMVMLSVAIGVNAGWLWLWRSADEPRWMVDAAINGFLVLMTYVAQTGKLMSPDVIEPAAKRRAGPYVAWTLVAAVALSVVGLVFIGELTALAEFLRPYLAEPPKPSWSTRVPPPAP